MLRDYRTYRRNGCSRSAALSLAVPLWVWAVVGGVLGILLVEVLGL